MRNLLGISCGVLCLLLAGSVGAAFAASGGSSLGGNLRVGAVRVDITPADATGLQNLWNHRFKGVHDKIYARALVVSDGTTTAAMVAVDTVEFRDASALLQKLSTETGIPIANITLAASHDHNAPMVALGNAGGTRSPGPGGAAWIAKVETDIASAIRQARAAMQPARVGIGTGKAYVNTNRSERLGDGWKRGINPDGPSDKTVWVVKFVNEAGEPIAVLMNYAVHSVVLEPENDYITGDLAGAAANFVEGRLGGKAVALWTMGAAGDQNPVFLDWDTVTEKAHRSGFALMETLGRMLGEEVVRVAGEIRRMDANARITADATTLTCPGRRADQEARKRGEVKFIDADPVTMKLGLLRINDIAFTTISGEVVTNIYWHLRKVSPLTNTIMVTIANGRVGYIVDDDAYDRGDLDMQSSFVKRGCAENGIVNGFLDLIQTQR